MAMQSSKPMVTSSSSSLLDSLHDDVLRAVLLRTSAADHLHLRLACHQIHDILDSPEYRTERSRTGWAEVHTSISGTQEDFDEEYGYVQNRGTIVVDGKKGGEVTYTLVPRKKTTIFHEVCDAISDEMQETGCTFCDTRGRPRLTSVKEAIKNNDTKGYFLYIATFELESDYRSSTWVGAKVQSPSITPYRYETGGIMVTCCLYPKRFNSTK